MGKCLDKSFRLPNFIRGPLLLRSITHEPPSCEFAQSAFFSFLSPMRAHSETLMLRRVFSSDLRGGFAHQPEKSLIGARCEGGAHFHISKFCWWSSFWLRPASPHVSALWLARGAPLYAMSMPFGLCSGVWFHRELLALPLLTGATLTAPSGQGCPKFGILRLRASARSHSAWSRRRNSRSQALIGPLRHHRAFGIPLPFAAKLIFPAMWRWAPNSSATWVWAPIRRRMGSW